MYGAGVLETSQDKCGSGVFAYVSRDVPDDLIEVGKKLFKAFRVQGHFFHFELFRTPSNELVVLEVNLRVGGGVLIDMYNFAFDTDFFDLWANVVTKKQNEIDNWKQQRGSSIKPKFYVCFASRRLDRNLEFTFTESEILTRCIPSDQYPNLKEDVQMMVGPIVVPLISQKSMGNIGYIFRALDELPLLQLKCAIMRVEDKDNSGTIESNSHINGLRMTAEQ